jgi:hypothetical protein
MRGQILGLRSDMNAVSALTSHYDRYSGPSRPAERQGDEIKGEHSRPVGLAVGSAGTRGSNGRYDGLDRLLLAPPGSSTACMSGHPAESQAGPGGEGLVRVVRGPPRLHRAAGRVQGVRVLVRGRRPGRALLDHGREPQDPRLAALLGHDLPVQPALPQAAAEPDHHVPAAGARPASARPRARRELHGGHRRVHPVLEWTGQHRGPPPAVLHRGHHRHLPHAARPQHQRHRPRPRERAR